jgi:peptide/nickel transport system permease protein
MRFIVRRLLYALFLLAGVSLLSFWMANLAPGSFFDEMRLNPQISAQSVDQMKAMYGFDRPLPVRYWRWVRALASGNMGISLAYNQPVSSLLWQRLGNTLLLTGVAWMCAWILAIPLGVCAAAWRGRWHDRLLGGATSLLVSLPEILSATLLLWFAAQSNWFPTGGMRSVRMEELGMTGSLKDLAWHLILPVLALTLVLAPALVRHVRTGLIQVMDMPFIQAARAHGVSQSRLLFRHALAAAAGPLVSLFGLSIASLLGASFVVEVILSWPGLGPMLLEAILARDLYLVLGAIMVSTLFLLGGTLLGDLLNFVFDPRIRVE